MLFHCEAGLWHCLSLRKGGDGICSIIMHGRARGGDWDVWDGLDEEGGDVRYKLVK